MNHFPCIKPHHFTVMQLLQHRFVWGTLFLLFAWLESGLSQTGAPSPTGKEPAPKVHVRLEHAKKTQTHVSKALQHPATQAAVAFKEETSGVELTPELMAVAEQVQWGRLPCELGQSVILNPISNAPGQFILLFKNNRYALTPTLSHTGAIRLEDARQGAVWIQLANKSMLFNTRLGQRMVDECKSKDQEQVALRQINSPPVQLLSAVSGAEDQR
jgi:hypothetical protein